jgi:DNA polymerase III delta subunit
MEAPVTAFSWVDSLLDFQTRESARAAQVLLGDGEEVPKLTGLLSKSLRILAHLKEGHRLAGEPDFLVSKLSRVAQRVSLSDVRGLVARAAEVDRWFKSSSIKPHSLLLSLSSTRHEAKK